MKNSELMKKADGVLADLDNGGLLAPEQADTFVRNLIKQPTLIRQARNVIMSAPTMEINKIGFGSRILKPAVENTGLIEADRSTPDFGQVLLEAKEVIAEVRIPYQMIESNIERGNVNFGMPAGSSDASGGIVATILALIAERVATDLEELAILGDTASGDAYLALLDGWLKKTTTNVVDQGTLAIDRAMFRDGLKALPDEYHRDKANLRHFVSVDKELDYTDGLAGRETAMGDAKHQQMVPSYAAGVRVDPVSLMPDASGLLVNPRNLIFGIHRDVSMETEKLISERQWKVVVTAKVDFAIEEEKAVVKYTNIG